MLLGDWIIQIIQECLGPDVMGGFQLRLQVFQALVGGDASGLFHRGEEFACGRIALKLSRGQGFPRFQAAKLILNVHQLAAVDTGDPGELLKLLQSVIREQPGLLLVLLMVKSGVAVGFQISGDIFSLQLLKGLNRFLAEGFRFAVGRFHHFIPELLLGVLTLGAPGVAFRQNGFSGGEVGGQLCERVGKIFQLRHLPHAQKDRSEGFDFFLGVAEIFELARCLVSLQAFEELFGLVDVARQRGHFIIGEQAVSPKRNAVTEFLFGHHQLFHPPHHFSIELDHRVRIILRDLNGQSGRQSQQIKKGFDGRNVPILGLLDVFEIDQIIQRSGGKLL